MIVTITVCYVLGLLIEKFKGRPLSKVFLIISVIFCLATLGYFKYADFFIVNLNKITGLSINLLKIALPIGISFYTFQILSYTIDIYRGNIAAQKNLISLATYVCLFPQLIAGPIVRYSDIEVQLKERIHSFDKTADGIKRFVIGISKKILLANVLGELCDSFTATDEKSILFYWLFVISYMLQIYFDFSGYSDMAIGLGKIFGFDFLENFNYPFISKSITEFWRRWHMSLGSWFRDYVYIPMGGNRVNKPKLLLNIFTVWFLTGFWHGAEWNFIVWGIYFAILLLTEKYFTLKYLNNSKFFNHIYVIFFTAISFAIFCGNSLTESISYVGGMFGANNIPFINESFIYALRNFGVIILIAIISSTPIPVKIINCLKEKTYTNKIIDILELPFMIFLLIISTAFLADGSFNPFLYFRF
mgnify:CR=1 FL=1